MTRQFYRDAHLVLLVYDCTRQDSYHSLQIWKKQVTQAIWEMHGRHVPCVIVSNKSDLKHVAAKFAYDEELGVPQFQTSAITRQGVTELLTHVQQVMLRSEKIAPSVTDCINLIAHKKHGEENKIKPCCS